MKIIKYILFVIGALVLAYGIYVIYIFATYSRIEDNQVISIDQGESVSLGKVSEGQEYSIMTYNIGFGAYTPDYTFFMDGGSQSWAFSKEDVVNNVGNAANLIKSYSPDFAMIEEIDIDGTRSYHVNEYKQIKDILNEYQSAYALNYHSKFLLYPLTKPHGSNYSGLALFSKYDIDSALRRSFPISESFSKVVDLDRCYEIARIPSHNGKELVIVTAHLSAYSKDESVRKGQLEKLFNDLKDEYAKGNYVICGGDFNHDLEMAEAVDDSEVSSWAHAFPRSYLGENFRIVLDDYADVRDNSDNTCRDADTVFDPETSFTVTVDGFIVSDNILVTSYEHIDTDFSYSDHDPVYMKFILKEAE